MSTSAHEALLRAHDEVRTESQGRAVALDACRHEKSQLESLLETRTTEAKAWEERSAEMAAAIAESREEREAQGRERQKLRAQIAELEGAAAELTTRLRAAEARAAEYKALLKRFEKVINVMDDDE